MIGNVLLSLEAVRDSFDLLVVLDSEGEEKGDKCKRHFQWVPFRFHVRGGERGGGGGGGGHERFERPGSTPADGGVC